MTIEEKAKAYDKFVEELKSKFKDFQVIIYNKNDLEKFFSELKEPESEDDRIRKEIIAFLTYYHTGQGNSVKYNDDWIDWLEKQEGCEYIKKDWLEHIKQSWYKEGFIDGKYTLKKLYDNFKLWTIQDAKDGDVLVNDTGCIFIYKNHLNNIVLRDYCHLATPGYILTENDNKGGYIHITNVYPATKEQRDLLFAKMKEAGYEWDAEKKELKKIKQNLADNIIEEEKPLLEKFKQAVYDCAWEKVTCKKEGETKEEYANRWAEQFLLIVRDWADDYIDFTIQQKLRNSYEKGKTDIIEKQDEQNLADKVEPKFHKGDWI